MKAQRDKVISVIRGRELVGVYDIKTKGKLFFAECRPEIADKLIELLNSVQVKPLNSNKNYCDRCGSKKTHWMK